MNEKKKRTSSLKS